MVSSKTSWKLPTVINRNNGILLGIALSLTGAYWVILIWNLPVFRSVPGYFWHAMASVDKPLGDLWIFPLIVVLSVAIIALVLRYIDRHKLCLLLLILLGWCVQMGFGLIEGNGIDGIRSRMIDTGHAEFARLAVVENDLIAVATEYEKLLENPDIKYAQTKPPGQLLFHMVTQKISNLFMPTHTRGEKFIRLVTFASYVYPLISYLVIIPLYWLSRLFLQRSQAIYPCILFIFVPNVTLITLHLDQVLYPTLFLATMYLSCRPAIKGNVLSASVAGFGLYLALYVSFSLLPLVFFSVVSIAIFSGALTSGYGRIRPFLRTLAGFFGGAIILWALLAVFLNYDPIIRYQSAIQFHQTWKNWTPGIGNTLLFATLNYIEFALWTGIPIIILYLAGLVRAARSTCCRCPSKLDILSVSLAIGLILLVLLGTTKGEVARLWIYLVPLLCIFACSELFVRFRERNLIAFGVLLSIQLTTILLIKRFQDFW
ncbi:MAG: hypothetical protein KOO62_03155 [candidate division Zixibacteria bacterium]|nr:hypothetical protein [candidate division Zixibacteria bacterium]